MYLKGTFSTISRIIQKGQSDSVSSPELQVQENVMWKHLLPDIGFSFQMNEFCSIRVRTLWLRLVLPVLQLWTMHWYLMLAHSKKPIIWQFILLKGCRVCRSNVKMGWELRNVFLSVEGLEPVAGLKSMSEVLPPCELRWLARPWLTCDRSSVLRLDTEHNT